MTAGGADPAGRKDAVYQVVARLGDEIDDIVEEIVQGILAEVPSYVRLVEGDGPAFRDDVVGLVGLLLDALRADRLPVEEHRGAVSDLAERRARGGLGLDQMQHAIHVGERVGRRRLFAAWDDLAPADRDAAAFDRMSDRLTQGVFEWRRAVQEGFARVEDERRRDRDGAREGFLRHLLAARVVDASAVRSKAAAVGIDLTLPAGLVVLTDRIGAMDDAHEERPGGDWRARVRECARALAPPPPAILVEEPEPAAPAFAVLVVPDLTASRRGEVLARLGDVCAARGMVGVHATVSDLTALHAAFRCLHAPVPVLGRVPSDAGCVTTPEAIRGLRLAGALEPAEQDSQLRFVFGAIMADPRTGQAHLDSIRALEQAGWEVGDAARLLHISESGLRERMRRIEELSGLDLKRDRFHFTLGLRVAELVGDRLRPAGHPWWTAADAGNPA